MDTAIEETTASSVMNHAQEEQQKQENKFLTFSLDKEDYGLEILKVREIIGVLDITKVPQTPDFVEGVINLRGKVIPVIDLRRRFGLPKKEYNEQTCIIVIDSSTIMGVIVDTVQEVHDIATDNIEPAPELGTSINTDFILGMGKVEDQIKILLDIDEVLPGCELVQLGPKINTC